MDRNYLPLIILVILVLIGGFFAWSHVRNLEQKIGDLGDQVGTLQTQAQDAEARAKKAEERAEQQKLRAEDAEDRAGVAESQTGVAEQVAAAERQRAEEAKREKEAETAARQEAETAREEARKKAEDEQKKAEDAALDAKLAELDARDAKKEAERLKQQREEALNRLQKTLATIADTRRDALGLVMNLGDSIEFDFDKDELRPANREILSRIAGVLMTAEGFTIQVFGHTDDVGTEEYNLELSERRAKAVHDYLVEAGIDPEIISMKGFGKSQPLVEGTDDAARQKNRRVEIAVIQISGEMPLFPVVDDEKN